VRFELFRPLGRAGLAWRSLGLAARSASVWLPLCVLALARLTALLVLSAFHAPWLAAFSLPLVRWLGGETATHYPQHFFALPAMMAQVELFITVVIASIALGAAVAAFAACFDKPLAAPPWLRALAMAPHLLLLSLLIVVVTLACSALLDRLVRMAAPERILEPARWGARFAVFVLLQSMLAYSIAAVVLLRRSVLRAAWLSILLARHHPLTTLILVGVPGLLLQLAILFIGRFDPTEIGLTPEWIVAGLILQVLLELGLAFVVLGSTTRLFLSRVRLA
jgi:hypothetical protein